jgi:hypothetical protein
MFEIHHQSNRWDFYKSATPITWDHRLNSWCVFDPRLIGDISKQAQFHVVNYGLAAQFIMERTGIDLSFTRLLFEQIPLANEGEKHAALRRRMAHAIAEREELAVESFRLKLVELGPRIILSGRSVNLMDEFFIPLVEALITGLIGPVDVQRFVLDSISCVFGRTLSLNRRKTIEAQISQLVNWLAQADELQVEPRVALAMMVLGKDSLIGSLSCSLHTVLSFNPGVRCFEIEWPQLLPTTGVPYFERIATDNITIETHHFNRGDRVRLYFDACSGLVGSPQESLYFGAGRHMCLGKRMSQKLWQLLIDYLSSAKVRVSIEDFQFRPNDLIFNYPSRFVVQFDE